MHYAPATRVLQDRQRPKVEFQVAAVPVLRGGKCLRCPVLRLARIGPSTGQTVSTRQNGKPGQLSSLPSTLVFPTLGATVVPALPGDLIPPWRWFSDRTSAHTLCRILSTCLLFQPLPRVYVARQLVLMRAIPSGRGCAYSCLRQAAGGFPCTGFAGVLVAQGAVPCRTSPAGEQREGCESLHCSILEEAGR